MWTMKNLHNSDTLQINYIIRFAKQNDFDNIRSLWKKNTGPLDACIVNKLINNINNNECLVAVFENNIIGFCVSHYMKNKRCMFIDDICVDIQFRKIGIATNFINTLKQRNKPILADCFEGENNNTFWNKIGERIEIRKRKTDTIYRYLVWYPDKLFKK